MRRKQVQSLPELSWVSLSGTSWVESCWMAPNGSLQYYFEGLRLLVTSSMSKGIYYLNRASPLLPNSELLQMGVYSIILRGWDYWIQVQCWVAPNGSLQYHFEGLRLLVTSSMSKEIYYLNRASPLLPNSELLQMGVYSIILRGWDYWLQVQCQKESIT